MAGRLPPFTLDDFKLSPEKRAEICDGLTERQTFMVNQWMDLHDKLNVGDWSGFDDYLDKEKMTQIPLSLRRGKSEGRLPVL